MATNFIRLDALEATYFDRILTLGALSRHCPLDNGRHILASNGSIAPDFGTFMRLPVELQLQVILQLDMASLLVWMRVNKSAMEFFWSLVEWRTVSQNYQDRRTPMLTLNDRSQGTRVHSAWPLASTHITYSLC
jgi:hypothetical protein